MKTKIKNFWESISSYELCFCAENIILIYCAIRNRNFNNIGFYTGIIIVILSSILLICVILSNFYNKFDNDNINLSYNIEKKIIVPLNFFKSIFLLFSIYFFSFKESNNSIELFVKIALILFLLVTNLKYYHTVLNIKERILKENGSDNNCNN